MNFDLTYLKYWPLLWGQSTHGQKLNNKEWHFHHPPSEELLASAHFLPTLFPVLALGWICSLLGKPGRQHLMFFRKIEQWSKLPSWVSMMRYLQPLITPLASWPTGVPQMGHKCRPSPQEPKFRRKFSSKSTLMCHQGGLCSVAIRATAIKGKFPFYMLRPSAAGSHDSPRSLIYHLVALFL